MMTNALIMMMMTLMMMMMLHDMFVLIARWPLSIHMNRAQWSENPREQEANVTFKVLDKIFG